MAQQSPDRKTRRPSKSDAEAVDWLLRLTEIASESKDSAAARQEVQEEFNRWATSSPDKLRSFVETASIFEALGECEAELIQELVAHVDPSGSVVALTPGRKRRLVLDPSADAMLGDARVGRFQSKGLLAATMLSIMILGGFVWHWLEGETYKTQAGEWRPLRFEDGSFVRLSEQSEIRVSFSKNRRQIELVRGEALFDVARDERRPLFVKSGTAEIQALGTRFDVTRRGGPTRVDVVDGSVRVNVISDASPPWLGSPTGAEASTHQEFNEHTRVLKKNEGATVEGQVIIPSDEADVRRIVDEQSYALDYDRQRLSIVAAQFNTYNRRQLRIADRAAGEKRISGTYRADHPEGLVLAILDMYPDLTVRETEDGWVVEERKR